MISEFDNATFVIPDSMTALTQMVKKHSSEWVEIPTKWYKGQSLNANAALERNKIAVDRADKVLVFWDGHSEVARKTINYCRQNKKPVVTVGFKP